MTDTSYIGLLDDNAMTDYAVLEGCIDLINMERDGIGDDGRGPTHYGMTKKNEDGPSTNFAKNSKLH